MFARVHHIGIAVADMEAALNLYQKTLGGEMLGRDESFEGAMDVAMLRLGGGRVELIAAKRPDTPIAKFLAGRGEGLHHLAFEVEALEPELVRLKREGFQLMDERPRRGFRNTRVAFVHPKSTRGALWELVERPRIQEGAPRAGSGAEVE